MLKSRRTCCHWEPLHDLSMAQVGLKEMVLGQVGPCRAGCRVFTAPMYQAYVIQWHVPGMNGLYCEQPRGQEELA